MCEKSQLFSSSLPHCHSGGKRLYHTMIHWQPNESYSPKLFMLHKGQPLLALVSEWGSWTLGGSAATVKLVTVFIYYQVLSWRPVAEAAWLANSRWTEETGWYLAYVIKHKRDVRVDADHSRFSHLVFSVIKYTNICKDIHGHDAFSSPFPFY